MAKCLQSTAELYSPHSKFDSSLENVLLQRWVLVAKLVYQATTVHGVPFFYPVLSDADVFQPEVLYSSWTEQL